MLNKSSFTSKFTKFFPTSLSEWKPEPRPQTQLIKSPKFAPHKDLKQFQLITGLKNRLGKQSRDNISKRVISPKLVVPL